MKLIHFNRFILDVWLDVALDVQYSQEFCNLVGAVRFYHVKNQ